MYPKTTVVVCALVAGFVMATVSFAEELAVKISADLPSLDVTHAGKKVTIMRNQDQEATIQGAFAKTSRKCPPFCIQPSTLAPGVETIAELEVLDYVVKIDGGDASIMLVDSRTPDWVAKGTIPSAVNIPWKTLSMAHSDPITIAEILEEQLGAKQLDSIWDFSEAKTLVLFCNGMWCGQSPTSIKTLLKVGYPPHKLKWYRGGMQDWSILGLTTVKPDS